MRSTRHRHDGSTRENVTDGPARRAGAALRGPARPPARGGLPHARVARRSRGRGAGGLAAARQLASRARRRVRGAAAAPDIARQREVVGAFLAAARGGDFEALVSVLDPEVVFRPDPAALRGGPSAEVRGAQAVAKLFSGRAQAARAALVNGAVGVVVAPRGRLFLVLGLKISAGKISEVEVIADPARLRRPDPAVLVGGAARRRAAPCSLGESLQ